MARGTASRDREPHLIGAEPHHSVAWRPERRTPSRALPRRPSARPKIINIAAEGEDDDAYDDDAFAPPRPATRCDGGAAAAENSADLGIAASQFEPSDPTRTRPHGQCSTPGARAALLICSDSFRPPLAASTKQ